MLKKRWVLGASILAVPLLLFAVLAERASWRPKIHKAYDDSVWQLSFSADGKSLASIANNSHHQLKISILDSNSLLPFQTMLIPEYSRALALAPDFKHLAISYEAPSESFDAPASLRIYDTATTKLLYSQTPSCLMSVIAFSPHGDFVASGSESCGAGSAGHDTGGWMVMPLRGGKLQSPLWHDSDPVAAMAFAPNNQEVVTGSDNGTLKLWSLNTRKLLRTLDGHKGKFGSHSVLNMAFSMDGRLLASSHLDASVCLWDKHTGKIMYVFKVSYKWATAIAFSPDGNILAVSEGSIIKLWDTSRGQELRTLKTQHGVVRSLAFTPDGNTLASGYDDGTIALWRVR